MLLHIINVIVYIIYIKHTLFSNLTAHWYNLFIVFTTMIIVVFGMCVRARACVTQHFNLINYYGFNFYDYTITWVGQRFRLDWGLKFPFILQISHEIVRPQKICFIYQQKNLSNIYLNPRHIKKLYCFMAELFEVFSIAPLWWMWWLV